MQNSVLKNLTLFLLTFFSSFSTLYSQSDQVILARADSLFIQKHYTQSFELYNTLFEKHRYTPTMLLKMAYIEEGLHQIARSAYYLNLYYLATRDEEALVKLEELANKYRLEGYASTEVDRIFSIYCQHHTTITWSLGAAIFFLITLLAVQRLQFKSKPYAAWSILLIVSIIFFVHLQASEGYSKAIIINNNTYLMDGPSAGASVIGIIREGHRVNVTGKSDIWLRVAWGEKEAYIKESNLLPVKL